MPTVSDILARKGTHVEIISPMCSVFEAALLMNDHKIGSLVVVAGDNVVGIISERDILVRIVAECRDPAATLVEDVMTTEVMCCRTHTPLDEARGTMKNRRIRHLPVLDESNQLLGLISIGDLNAYDNNSQELTIHLLEEYIHGQT